MYAPSLVGSPYSSWRMAPEGNSVKGSHGSRCFPDDCSALHAPALAFSGAAAFVSATRIRLAAKHHLHSLLSADNTSTPRHSVSQPRRSHEAVMWLLTRPLQARIYQC